jgi:hypothetical protein
MGFRSRFRTALTITIAASSLAGAAGCQMSKSSNPLAPTVAGPIAGVVITTPIGVEPGQDWQIRLRDQPIKLMIQNADTSGVRTLSYAFEVASDAAFNQIVYKKTGVSAGNVTTTLQLPDALPSGRTYWWRARAEDGANTGSYSKVVSFSAVAPVVLGTPNVISPSGTIPTATPAFQISSGGKSGPYEHVIWTLQVANDAGFSSIAALFIADENGGQKTINENYTFLNNKTYYWRVQAKDIGDSQAVSNWSTVLNFTTAVPAPTPPPGSGGGGPIGNGNWQSCGSTPGQALVECVRDAVYRQSTLTDAFAVTKRVAWLLRGQGAGLLIKNGGENIISWQGYSFSISRMCYSNGALIKVLSDAGEGGGNGATWDTSLFNPGEVSPSLYVPAINPDLP